MNLDFADAVRQEIVQPLETLCELLSKEGCYLSWAAFRIGARHHAL